MDKIAGSLLSPAGTFPLFLYFLVLTFFLWRRRPTILTGRTDALLLTFGLSGVVALGIIPSFVPFSSLLNYGYFAWVLLFLLYIFLVFSLSSAFSRKIIIYNLNMQRAREVLVKRFPNSSGSPEGSDSVRFTGTILEIPALSITARLKYSRRHSSCTELVLFEPFPEIKNWCTFCAEIRLIFSNERVSPNFILAGLLTGFDIVLGIWIFMSLFCF